MKARILKKPTKIALHHGVAFEFASGSYNTYRLPFRSIKNRVLGTKYCLHMSFVDAKSIAKLNLKYRNKNKPTDVLSFSLEKEFGEIIIAPEIALEKSKEFAKTPRQYLGFLFIHALLHLKGFAHSSTMEHEEQRFVKEFRL